jgi:maltose/moltooligosaccharide transporter
MVPSEQRNIGYSIQSFLINIGAVFGSILPFVLTNVIGLENTSAAGTVAPSVIWAFYIGASVMLGSVLWTVIRTKEYAPGTNGLAELEQQESLPLSKKLANFFWLDENHANYHEAIGGSAVLLLVRPFHYVGLHHASHNSTHMGCGS